MGRFTQQQLREVLRVDRANDYVLCCPAGSDVSLIHPDIIAAPNATVARLPAAVEPAGADPHRADDSLERAELFQAWVEERGLELFHATTPMLACEPVLTTFDACPLVATLYDLIPLVFPERYFNGSVDPDRFLRAVGLLLKARRLIAISQSASHDAFHYLGVTPDRVDVAYPMVDPAFRPVDDAAAEAALRRLRADHAVPDRYILSVTHFHHSKNVELLFGAYAQLPRQLRRQLPLVLCCTLDDHTTRRMRAMAGALGIAGEVVVTGMVTDGELAALYTRATIVVHPSRYEGFGLPVVEAMACGAPVITTTSSSLPEAAGGAARLVDPDDPGSLADAIIELSSSEECRREMRRRGLLSAQRFGADQLAAATLACYRAAGTAEAPPAPDRPRIALWTPVPPQQSGIADYSAELVEELASSCDIEIFVDGGFVPDLDLVQRFPVHHHSAFGRRQARAPFDVTVYQMGNSHFHWYMYDTLRRYPGVVALHDLAWSQVLYTQRTMRDDLATFISELAEAEGPEVAKEFQGFDRFTPPVRERARMELLDRHPMLAGLVDRSLAQVVLLDSCRRELIEKHPNARVRVVEMGVSDPYRDQPEVEIGAARARLRLSHETFVIGTFGIVHPVKRVESCLRAVARLLPTTPDLLLLVVGRMAGPEYEAHLRSLAAELGVDEHIRFVGHASRETFDAHLIASDVVVNLRTPTHQHMSAIVCRAAAAAKPVVISDLPGWSFLSEPCFVKIPVDDSEVDILVDALAALAEDPALRRRLSRSARARFHARGSSRQMAAGYLRTVKEILQGVPV